MTPNKPNLTREQELIRLLELKLIPDHLRTLKQQLEIDRLNQLHNAHAIVFAIQSPGHSAQVSQDYQTTFVKKLGYPKPQQKNGMLIVAFKSEVDALDFLLSQTSKGRKIKVLDGQNRIIVMSNGNGVLQHADGRPFSLNNIYAAFLTLLLNRNQPPALSKKTTIKAAQPQGVANPQPISRAPRPLARPVMTPVEEVKRKSPYPTPFKRTPFEQ